MEKSVNTISNTLNSILEFAKKNADLLVSFLILFVPNIIMWLVFFPGYFQSDHQATVASIINGTPSEWHSLVWGYIFYCGVLIFHSYDFAGFLQSLAFAVIILFGISELKKCGIIKRCWLFSLLMAFFPTFLMYNQLYSSDMIFAYTLFTITCLLASCAKQFLNDSTFHVQLSSSMFVKILLFTFVACVMRKNAIVIPIFVIIVALLCFKKRSKKIIQACAISLVLAVATSFCLNAVVGAEKSPSQELMAVPAAQIALTYKSGGEIPQECREVFENFKTPEEWSDSYVDWIADSSKLGLKLTPRFVVSWLKTGFLNVKTYLRAYIDLLYQFYDFGSGGFSTQTEFDNRFHSDFSDHDRFTLETIDSNVANSDEGVKEYLSHFGVEQSEVHDSLAYAYYILASSKYGILNLVGRYVLFNRGACFWTLLICLFIALRKSFIKEYLLLSAPCIATLVSLLVFSPVGTMRYAMQTYYAIFAIIVAVIYLCRNAQNCREETSKNLDTA